MAEGALNVIGPDADGTRAAAAGYDHSWFDWSALPLRPPLAWPDGAEVAVSVVVNLGAVEWEQGTPPLVPPPGGRGIGSFPDVPRMSHREYGHRVGIFRLLEVLGHLQIPLAVGLDVLTAEHYDSLLAHVLPAAEEILAAGLSASRPISSSMTEAEETAYVLASLDRLEAATGTRPAGWIGPEQSESACTPGVLAGVGMDYVADWCGDDQPYAMSGAEGLWSFPLSWELSDLSAMFIREVSPSVYRRSLDDAVEVLRAEGRAGAGRVLGLHLYPWVSGQAFRIGAVEAALDRFRRDPRVWMATPGRILDWCRPGGP